MDRPFNQQQSMQHGNDPRRIQVNSVYSRNVLERPQQQQNTVQSIMVDPDKTINYVNYTDQICLKTSRLGKDPERISGGKTSPNVSSINDERRSPNVKRSLSPLPESVSRKLKNGPYERFVKPCKPSMYQFFMEHHIYTLIEQYKERNQRSKQLIGEMKAAELNDKIQEKMLRVLRQKESNYIRLKRQKMNKSMFDIIKHIGVGAFGKVALVKKKDTKQYYAMKILSKEDVIQKQQAAHVKAERDILAEANSEWIVRLFFSFQDSRNLYFIMEYVPGGDMMQLLIIKGVFTEKLARFYIAELTCAIEYVHNLGFIHRDIKPDNILIDKEGHIKLTDFGLCTGLRWTHDKRIYRIYEDTDPNGLSHFRDDSFSLPNGNGQYKVPVIEYKHKKRHEAHSVVGTGNYMAPEVINRTGHTQACDLWSVGVILYEMVFGRPPFMSQTEDPNETARKIVNWEKYLDLTCMSHLPAPLSDNCIDMIERLCCDEKDRISTTEMKKHPWFSGIDFNTLRESKAEFIPTVKHAEDTSNFDTTDLDNDYDTFKKETLKSHNFNPAFFDFTFRHFFYGVYTPLGRTQHRPGIPFMHMNNKPSSSGSSNDRSQKLNETKNNNFNSSHLNNEIINKEPPLPAKPFKYGRSPHVSRSQPRGHLKDLFRQQNNDAKNDERYQQRL